MESAETLAFPSCYRYNTVREYAASLKLLSEQYHAKMNKYRRRITAIDVTVYSVSGLLAGTGVILSSVTIIAPIAVPIVISAVTTLGGVATAITTKLSSCSQTKLREYSSRYTIGSDGYSLLSSMISTSLDDAVITDEEFSTITAVYKSTMQKLENFTLEINNNNNERDASTDRNKYHTGENNVNFNYNKITGIHSRVSNIDTCK